MKKVFLDMDGVLVDFDGYFQKKFGKPYFEMNKSEVWKHVETIPSFFRNLPKLEKTDLLYSEVLKTVGNPILVEILTAKPKRTGHLISCARDKEGWVREHLDENIFVNCVDGWDKKRHFCQPGDILIDDSQRNCEDWEGVGGIAIHYSEDKIEIVLAELKKHYRVSHKHK